MTKKRDFEKKPCTIIDVRRWVMRDTRTTFTLRGVIFEIINFDGERKGTLTFSQQHLAEELGLNRKTIKRALKAGVANQYFTFDTDKTWTTRVIVDWKSIDLWVIESATMGHTVHPSVPLSPDPVPLSPISVPSGDTKRREKVKRTKENKRVVETFSPEVEKSPDGVFFRGDKNSNPSERDSISEEERVVTQHLLDSQGSC